ncbi:hypothetical protein [Streptomyces sp. NPDC102462]|uniref:hypothetical protein n=1 Tax=Streptomyces sp. NPDC102462 TaxID=3366178 RepID=UPI00381C7D64
MTCVRSHRPLTFVLAAGAAAGVLGLLGAPHAVAAEATADLSITKVGPAPAPDGRYNYQIAVKNNGPDTSSGWTVRDIMGATPSPGPRTTSGPPTRAAPSSTVPFTRVSLNGTWNARAVRWPQAPAPSSKSPPRTRASIMRPSRGTSPTATLTTTEPHPCPSGTPRWSIPRSARPPRLPFSRPGPPSLSSAVARCVRSSPLPRCAPGQLS